MIAVVTQVMAKHIASATRAVEREMVKQRTVALRSLAAQAIDLLTQLTPRSKETHEHVADQWTITWEGSAANPTGFFVHNKKENQRLLIILEFGTSPHIIEPNDVMALHFFTRSGQEVFSKRVEHPGTIPYKMVRGTMKQLERRMGSILREWAVSLEGAYSSVSRRFGA